MNRFLIGVIVLVALPLILAGCSSSSSGPSGSDDDPDVFDIPGLTAFYEFNGTMADASGGGHNGRSELRMHYISDHNGAAESAIYLTDDNDIEVPDHDDLDFTGAFSVSAWILADFEAGYCSVVDKGYAEGAWSVGSGGAISPIRTPLYLFIGSDTTFFYLNEAVPVGQGTWVHFACCFNDTTDQTTFYVNGEYAYTQTASEPVTLTTTDRDLQIGSSYWNNDYAGGIDQLGLFDRELTADEVEVLYEYD